MPLPSPHQQRVRDAIAQLTDRYCGEPREDVLLLLEALGDFQDDRCHGRDQYVVMLPALAKVVALAEQLELT